MNRRALEMVLIWTISSAHFDLGSDETEVEYLIKLDLYDKLFIHQSFNRLMSKKVKLLHILKSRIKNLITLIIFGSTLEQSLKKFVKYFGVIIESNLKLES